MKKETFMPKKLNILIILMSFIYSQANAMKVVISINGLTCSLCSKTVEISLKKIDYVNNVKMRLDSAIAVIDIDTTSNINLSLLPKAVKDAGFAVASVIVDFKGVMMPKDGCWFWKSNKLYVIDKTEGNEQMTLLGKGFSSKKETKKLKNKIYLKESCQDFEYIYLQPLP